MYLIFFVPSSTKSRINIIEMTWGENKLGAVEVIKLKLLKFDWFIDKRKMNEVRSM